MKNIGIDYGRGLSNIDKETGIRYGVISSHKVGQGWYEESEPIYYYNCPICGNEWGYECLEVCPSCRNEIDPDEFDMMEVSGFEYVDAQYEIYQGQDDTDLFIIKSPYYTECMFCSPCAPGAGDITNQVEGGVKAYCLGKDWFYSPTEVPYKIFNVKGE